MSRFKELPKDFKLGDGALDYPTGPSGKQSSFLEKFTEGETKILRILPPVGAMLLPYVGHAVHYCGVYPNSHGFMIDGKPRGVTCLESHKVGPCPLCEINRFMQANAGSDASQLSIRYLMNVLWFDPSTKGYVAKIWGGPRSVITFLEQQNPRVKTRDGLGIFSVREGHDIDVARRGKNYFCTPDMQKTDVTRWADEFEKDIPDLTNFVKYLTPEVISNLALQEMGRTVPVGKILGLTSSPSVKKVPAKRGGKK